MKRRWQMVEPPSRVPEAAVERLRCPLCGKSVVAGPSEQELRCADGHVLSLADGYLDAGSRHGHSDSSTARTFASFGFEWTSFDEVRPEDEELARVYFRDVDLSALSGMVGLDAGCGKGRFTRVLARHMAAVVALDGSDAVRSAVRNLSGFGNTFVVKADLRGAPLAAHSFDFITCLGVLHHLEDPRAGFKGLVELLAPGGRILLYLYSRPPRGGLRSMALAAAAAMRKVTVALPARVLKLLCVPMAGALWSVFVVPGRFGEDHGVAVLARLPMQSYRRMPRRSLVLDTFDRLSAPIEHRYIWEDIAWWFQSAGLVVDAARDETGWFVLAHRPA